MSAIIRLLRDDDLEAARAILNQSILTAAANFLLQPIPAGDFARGFRDSRDTYPWLAAEVDGQLAGLAWAQAYKPRPAYRFTAETSVYLDPAYHGRRLGNALYARLIPMLEAQGFHALVAGIVTPNPASVRLHESFGFRAVGVLEEVGWKFDAWRDVGLWVLALRGSEQVPVETRPVADVLSLLDAS